MSAVRAIAIGLLACFATSAGAQVYDTLIVSGPSFADGLRCGEYSFAPASDFGPRPPARPPRATDTVYYIRPPELHEVIDTTIVLDVASRDWRHDRYSGGVAISTDDMLHRQLRYSACVGASVHLAHAAVALRGVRGVIHLRGAFGALEHVGGRKTQDGPPMERPRRTSPAVPPRR